MTTNGKRYSVVYSGTLKAFVINDAVLGDFCALDGETLKFTTMRAAGEWLRGCRTAGLPDDAPEGGLARKPRQGRIGAFLDVLVPFPLV